MHDFYILDLFPIQPQRCQQVQWPGVVSLVELKDMGRALHEAQAPIRLQRAQLSLAQVAQARVLRHSVA
jgi:hypothetical protein